MMKKSIMMLCAVVALSLSLVCTNVQAQTKIKDNTVPSSSLTPDSTAIMELESTHRGLLPPRMDSTQRNEIGGGSATQPNAAALKDGMIIYNTDEKCYDYWDDAAQAWMPLCGSQPPAKLAVDCGSITIPQNDTPFTLGVPLGTQVLQIPITVNTAGNYTIVATPKTPNGYSFTYSGTAGAQGTQLINIPAQGTPINQETDTLNVLINNQSLPNCQNLTIPIQNTAASFVIASSSAQAVNGVYNCGQDHFGGQYSSGVAMTTANTDTVAVNVQPSNPGQNVWSITTTSNGVTFTGSGRFSDNLISTGGDTLIVLKASGTPTATVMPSMQFTYTTNSPGTKTEKTACIDTLRMALHSPLIWVTNNGYNLTNNVTPIFTQNMSLFGPGQNSVFPVATSPLGSGTTKGTTGITITPVSMSNIASSLNTTKPDILVIAWGSSINNATTQIISYLKSGGVVLFNGNESTSNGNLQTFFNSLYGTSNVVIVNSEQNSNSYAYPFTNTSLDAITGGPFGTFGAPGSGGTYQYWGEDGGGTDYITGISDADPSATIYSSAENTVNPIGVSGSATMFKSGQYNLWWVGDGGFMGSNNNTSTTSYPFRYTGSGASMVPVQMNYGNGASYMTNNGAFTCNLIAWALQQAQYNGINKYK